MILAASLAIVITVLAAWTGLRILKKEYLPLLEEFARTKQILEKMEKQGGNEEADGL